MCNGAIEITGEDLSYLAVKKQGDLTQRAQSTQGKNNLFVSFVPAASFVFRSPVIISSLNGVYGPSEFMRRNAVGARRDDDAQ
jgi:hypothetical protein